MRECSYNGKCGSELLCVYPDGEVGFCGRDNLSRHFVYGSLKDKPLLELYHSANAKLIRSRQKELEQNESLKLYISESVKTEKAISFIVENAKIK